jgi:hypothetical protein
MRGLPTAISDADLQIAVDPVIGGEAKVYAAFTRIIDAGNIFQPAADDGELDLLPTFDNNVARHYQVVVDRTGARSTEKIVLTFNVEDEDDNVTTATAEFPIPDRSLNQAFSVPQGAATDLIVTGSGNGSKKVKEITSLASIDGGSAGNRYRIIAIPDEDDFSLIGCTNSANFQLPLGESLPIPCGLNPSAFVKRGRGEAGRLTVQQKYVDYLEGIARFNGHYATAMIEFWKDERLLTERIFCGQWKPISSPSVGDGNDVVTAEAAGNFESFAVFTAR